MHHSSVEIDLISSDNQDTQVLNGFAKALSGSGISYHSHHPEAETGLIARANASQNRIAWQTDPISSESAQQVQFVMLAGISGSKGGGHTFHLSADGKRWGNIVTATQDQMPFCDAVSGVRIGFEPVTRDQFGDHFGILRIGLSPDAIPANDILTVELSCHDEGSEDWIIVYDYQFAFRPRVGAEPILKTVGEYQGQILKVIYDHFGQASSLKISSSMEDIHCHNPQNGANIYRIAVPAVVQEGEIKLRYLHNGRLETEESLVLRPVTPRQVHILPFSHNDIGYTDLQEAVRLKQHLNIDLALERITQTAHLDQDARATWNLEVLWALESWWQAASLAQKLQFVQAVKDGHIGLNALHNNLLSGLCNQPELEHHLDLARQIMHETGLKIESAAVTDIPGFVWSLVTALTKAGVKYFAIAPNNGDRVGHIYEQADQPFYWSSPDGSARVLTWIVGAGYAMFHREPITGTGLKKALNYLKRLETDAYPYSLVPLAYTIGGDNGGFDEALPDFVQNWNAQYLSPRFIISTHRRFFEEFASAYAAELPVLKGDMTPYWEDGAASTAHETKLSRNAADRLVRVEELYRQHFPDQVPHQEIHTAWQQVIFWDEHTWGAWNSVSEPDDPIVIQQWHYKQRFALEADRLSRKLLNSLTERGIDISEDGFQDDFYPGPADFITPPEAVSRLENDWIALDLEPSTCSVKSMRLKAPGLVFSPGDGNFFQLYHMQGSDRHNLKSVSGGRISGLMRKNGCQQLMMSGSAPGCSEYHLCLRIPDDRQELELAVCLDKRAIRTKESIHLAFPFELAAGTLSYDGAGTWIDPQKDFLKVACRNFFCPQRRVRISSPQTMVTVTLNDNPLIEIGRITAEEPWLKTTPPGTRFFAYLINNYWHTNYKADQSGRMSFRWRIEFTRASDEGGK